MSSRYKLIISSKSLYKEIDIPADSSEIRIGTSPEADVRLRKELFFSPVDITLTKDTTGWSVFCSDNLYFTVGDIRKLLTKRLNHGDELFVRYQDSNIDVFSLSFVIDFDYEVKKYDLEIDIAGKKKITIGGLPSCDISYSDEYLGKDSFVVENNNGKLTVIDSGSRYGVSVNGARIDGSHSVKDYEFFSIVGLSFFYKNGKLYTSSSSKLKISGLTYCTTQESTSCFEYPNLFKLLNTIVVKRKKVLSSKGVGNFAAYLEAGYDDMPMVVVAIDNMAAFKEYFPEQSDELDRLSREAQGVGISFVITAATSNALNYRAQANFGKKIVLNCNDPGEYGNVFGHCKTTPKENPGRGLLMMDKRILEYQAAMFGNDAREADRSKTLMEYIEQRNVECTGKVVEIPMVPDKLSLATTMAEDAVAFRNKGIVPVGMNFATVALTSLNIASNGSISLLGDSDSREAFVRNFLATLSKTAIFHNVNALVVDDRFKKLRECESYGFVRQYTSDAADGFALISDFCDEVRHRKDDDNDDVILLVINSVDLLRKINADKNDSKELALALKSAAEASAFIVLSGIDNQPVGFNASELLKAIKEERRAILFAPITENKMFELSSRAKADTLLSPSNWTRSQHGLHGGVLPEMATAF